MQQGGPAQVEVVAQPRHVVQYLQRVVEIVLVRAAVFGFNHVQRCHFGQDEFQQAAALQFHETARGLVAHHNLVELHDDTFCTHNFKALAVAPEGFEGFLFNLEMQCRGKAHTAHHAQRVVAEGDVGVEGRGDDAVFDVHHATEGVNEFAQTVVVEADGQGIDGEIAAVLVVLQRAVLNDRLARIVGIAFAACTYEFHLLTLPFQLGRAEIAKYRQVGTMTDARLDGFGNGDTAAFDHHVNILRRTVHQQIAHVAADDVALHTQFVGHLTNELKHRGADLIFEFLGGKMLHIWLSRKVWG